MEIITVECPKCHGSLHVDQHVDKIYCMYCRAEVTVKNLQASGATVDSLIKRGLLLIEHSEWEKALEVFDQAANIDPENAQIYLGMLLAEARITREELLNKHTKPLSSYTSYKKAVRFADHELRKSLEAYNEITVKSEKDRKEKKEQQKLAESRRIAQIEKEVAKRLDWSHWVSSTLLSLAYTILGFEVLFLIVNGEFGLVNLGLFKNWDFYDHPSTLVMTILACWVYLWFTTASNRYKKIRALVEKELLGRE